jgi:hypothetical protein
VTLSVLPPNPTSWDATDGLVLHLKFDGDYQDASGRGNHGTAVGSPAIVSGRVGSALHFNTDKDAAIYNYVTLGKPEDLKFGTDVDFSVAYWVRTPAGQTNGDLPFLCSAVNSYGNAGLTFAPSYNLGGWSYSLNGVAQIYGANASINDGNWHHLLHSFNRKGDGITYLDGVQVDLRAVLTVGNVDTGNTFNVGQDPTGVYPETGLADIDDLGVWRRALTAYDAYAIHHVGKTYGASFDPAPVDIQMAVRKVGDAVEVSWNGTGILESADTVLGSWNPITNATSPYTIATPTGAGKYYRVRK